MVLIFFFNGVTVKTENNFQIVTNAFDHIIFYFSLIITLVIPMANTEVCVLTLAGATPLF